MATRKLLLPKLLPEADVRVRVPASTSNLGPGFDAVGCALKLENVFRWTLSKKPDARTTFGGPEAKGLPETQDTIAHAAFKKVLEFVGEPSEGVMPRLSLTASVIVPQARGLGSSSTALVAGILGASAMLRKPLEPQVLLDLAVGMEGHPDNVAPAILGGLVASASETGGCNLRLRLHRSLQFVLLIPNYEVKTADARAALPAMVPMKDAVFNASRTPLLLEALRTGRCQRLKELMKDRLHQDYRKPLYRHYDAFEAVAYKAGAWGFCVSGAGPAMLAVVERSRAQRVVEMLERARRAKRLPGRVLALDAAGAGARTRKLK
ncbi:MAG: homoserine kinase [Candidatus Sumerlaeia bacterium]|nr:homoserine kinase [Candidatus Sumerlaeia bacterium]